MKEIVLTGPNLQLDDLRWLVDRCEGLPGSSTVRVDPPVIGANTELTHPRIVVEDASRRPVMRHPGAVQAVTR